MEKILIGKIVLTKDIEMHNNQFSYAADYEDILVPAGEYPIYTYWEDIKKDGDDLVVWDSCYIGFEGKLIRGTLGGKKGDHTEYHQMNYAYTVADFFLNGEPIISSKYLYTKYILNPEWSLRIDDFTYDGERVLRIEIFTKKGTELTFLQ